MPIDVQQIVTLAISAIRDIAVAVAGAEAGAAIDNNTTEKNVFEDNTLTGEATISTPAEPASRPRGRPRKNVVSQQATAVETDDAAPEQEEVSTPEVAPEPVVEIAEPAPTATAEVVSPTHDNSSLDDLFNEEPEEEVSKSPDVLRQEIGAMIVALIPRLGGGKVGKDKIVVILKKYGASAPRDIKETDLKGVHDDLSSLMATTGGANGASASGA